MKSTQRKTAERDRQTDSPSIQTGWKPACLWASHSWEFSKFLLLSEFELGFLSLMIKKVLRNETPLRSL